MVFSIIASKKAAPVAALIRKLAFNDARALQTASVQSTRSFNTNSREVEALARQNDVPYSSCSALHLSSQSGACQSGALDAKPIRRVGYYEIEDDNRLEVRKDMPGLGKEHVKLIMKQNTLIIKGDGEEEELDELGSKSYHYRIDFLYGYNLNEIQAEMKNGILKIVVPKGRQEETKGVFQINVK